MPEPARPRATAALALGANLPSRFGTPEATLREALRRLEDLGTVTAVSSFHTTEPVGYLDQPKFINAAALLETALPPRELMDHMLALERALGRTRDAAMPKGPRVIDLDLLLYSDSDLTLDTLVLDVPGLVLPHPAMHQRSFVLAPLAEIAPEARHPRLGLTVRELLESLKLSS